MRPQVSIGPDLPLAIALPTHQEIDSKWTGWHVWAVDLHRESNGYLRLNVFIDPTDGTKPGAVLEFFLGSLGRTASPKFIALASACGLRGRITSVEQLEGRDFSMRNGGKRSIDYGPLQSGLAQR